MNVEQSFPIKIKPGATSGATCSFKSVLASTWPYGYVHRYTRYIRNRRRGWNCWRYAPRIDLSFRWTERQRENNIRLDRPALSGQLAIRSAVPDSLAKVSPLLTTSFTYYLEYVGKSRLSLMRRIVCGGPICRCAVSYLYVYIIACSSTSPSPRTRQSMRSRVTLWYSVLHFCLTRKPLYLSTHTAGMIIRLIRGAINRMPSRTFILETSFVGDTLFSLLYRAVPRLRVYRWILVPRWPRGKKTETVRIGASLYADEEIYGFPLRSIWLVSPPFSVFPFPECSNFVVDTCPDGNRCTSAASYKYIGARPTGRPCIPVGAARVDNRAFESI